MAPDTPPAIRDLTGGDPDAYPKDLDDLHAKPDPLGSKNPRWLAWTRSTWHSGTANITITVQWTRDELKLLKERGQPAIVIQ